MRVEALQKLLEAERLKYPIKAKTTVAKATLSSILYMGVSDEDIVRFVIPKIRELEVAGTCSKESLKKFILSHEAIQVLPSPVRHILDESIELRRMDSLSRLLSLNTKYTPCVAVTFYKEELIVSSNLLNPKEKLTVNLLSDCFARKMGLIQGFLLELIRDIPFGSQPNIEKIQFSSRAKLLAMEAVLNIIQASNGGVGDVVPSTLENRHEKRQNTIAHLQNALLKLGQHCVFGVLTNGKKGYSFEELNALLNKSITIITPNAEVLHGKQLHAEQSILYYLNEYTDFSRNSSANVCLGISKLCCQACHLVLNKVDKTTHRGTHGMQFPSVYDISTMDLFAGFKTKLGSDLCPEDSESDCDSIWGDVDDEVPSVEALLADARIDVVANNQFMLFKPFKFEAAIDLKPARVEAVKR
jgi:hypothetical protein